MRPDLATVFAGTNDVIRARFDPRVFLEDLRAMQSALVDQGATVLSLTLPDPSRVMPLGRLLRERVAAMNDAVRAACGASGAVVVDLAAHEVGGDPRLWCADRLHANAEGHARVAAALAHALGLPGADARWAESLPPPARRTVGQRAAAEWAWLRDYLAPWLWRHARGISSGDGRVAKRPALAPVAVDAAALAR